MTDTHLSVDNPGRALTRAGAYGRYVGRVGALAAALGIGLMVATSPGIASADSTSTATSNEGGTDTNTESNAAETGTDTIGGGTNTTEQSGTGSGASSVSRAAAGTTEDTKTSETTSTSIQVAPGVTISANSIKIGSRSITLGLEGLRPPTHAKTPVTEDSTPPVVPAPEVGQKVSTFGKTESKSAPTFKPNSIVSAPQTLKPPAAAVDDAIKNVKQLAAKVTEFKPVAAAQAFTASAARDALTPPAAAAAVSPVMPTPAPAARITTGTVGFLNQVVTNLLSPFLAPAPANTSQPVSPVAWAVLGWVRRNLFNQTPTFSKPVTSVQTGQTVTGSLGATDPEKDPLTYTVTDATQTGASTWKTAKGGTVTIDQATGNYSYTPADINYDAAQTDSFTVSVTDGNKINLLGLATPRTDVKTINVEVKPPTVERVILKMPSTVTMPVNPRFSEDGKLIYFSGSPAVGGVATTGVRKEIYQINADDVDGSTVKCVTCGASTNETLNLEKPVPFTDGSGRIIVLINRPNPAVGGASPTYSVFEPVGYNGNTQARIVPIVTPDGGGKIPPPGTLNTPNGPIPIRFVFPDGVVDRQREMRVSPDGEHVLFTRIVIGETGNFQALPIVGDLQRSASGDQYTVGNAVVVWPTGEGKQWTHDGKGVIIQGGTVDAGNIDDIYVDLSGRTGQPLFPGDPSWKGTRVTGNRDYDEDIDMSPNNQWIAVGSTRGFQALTAMTQIQRENFLPVYLAGVYTQYADNQVRNVSNQTWAVAVEDDLNGENGIPLFVQDNPATETVDEGDGWAARSMPSWNPDGTAVAFWESGNGDEHGIAPTESRLVIAKLTYTTSTGVPLTAEQQKTVFDPHSTSFKPLNGYVGATTPLPPAATYVGPGGGIATVTEVITGSGATAQTTRTVQYTDYVNKDGLILNGTESATYGASQNSSVYNAEITVTDAAGNNKGYLHAQNVVVQTFPQQTVSAGSDGRGIESSLDGNTLFIPDSAKAEAAKTGA
jgi:hypothetical protein